MDAVGEVCGCSGRVWVVFGCRVGGKVKREGKLCGYSGWVWMNWEDKLCGCCW